MFERFGLILFLAIGMVLWAVLPALAESVDTAWVRRYDGPGNSVDGASAIAVDDSGNAYVTGYSYGSGTDYDYATIKYYPNGDTAWVRRYNGSADTTDEAYGIAVDDSGNVYVTGISSIDGTERDFATIKYYPDGDTDWVRTYDGPGDGYYDVGLDIAVDDSNNVYVTGKSYGSGTDFDYATIKYYADGDTAWVRRYNGPGNGYEEVHAIAVDGSGNVYVTGDSPGSETLYDYATIRYKPNGDVAPGWPQRYNGPGNGHDCAYAIAVDGSGNVYVTGVSDGTGTGYEGDDYATIKYYPNGDTAWVRRYNGPENLWDWAEAIAVDDSGNVYVTGGSWGGATSLDCVTIKYYPDGDTAWVRRYNGLGNSADVAEALAVDSCDNVYVTGYSSNGVNDDYLTIIYYADGNMEELRYNGPGNGNDYASAIAVYGCDNVYVTGESWGSGTGFDYATIKYVQNDYVRDETGDRERPSGFSLFQNYPNPFNQSTKIEFTLAKSGFVSLTIYDILGRKVKTLVSEHVSSGYKSVLWDGKNDSGKDVASGIYFYQLKVEGPTSDGIGDFTDTKKLVLLK